MNRTRTLSLATGSLAAGTVALLVASPGQAVSTRTVTLDSEHDLAAGTLDRVAVSSDGTVVPGPDLTRLVLDPPGASIWSLLDMGDGTALAGSGVDGRVYRVAGGHVSLVAETGSVVVASLARSPDGTVYAGTLGDGKIFRIEHPANSHAETPPLLVALPGVEHVWALAWDAHRNALIAATGPDGKLFAIDRAGHATVLFDSDEPHLMCLVLASDGTVYTGSGGGHAVVYAVRGASEARAVARLTGDEVKALALDGAVLYAASNEFTEPPDPPRRPVSASRTPSAGGTSQSRPRPGHGHVYRITPDGVSEQVYNNADSHVTALETDARGTVHEVLAGLGVGGKIVAVRDDHSSRTVFDIDETQVLALDVTGSAHAFGAGDSAAVYVVGTAIANEATWTSRVLDGTTPSHWGAVSARQTGTLAWQARTGNSDPPDNTWSAWSNLTADGTIGGPVTRYAEVRARFGRDASAQLRAVTVYYLPTNQRPVLTELTGEIRNGDARPAPVKINWKVDNADTDTLRYRLRFRAENEPTWRTLLRNSEYVAGTSYEWSVDALPEGFYRIEVDASDEASNPVGEALHDVRVTDPVLIDNTPPRVSLAVAGEHVRGEMDDTASAVTRVEMAIDTQEWRPLRSVDGVLDQRRERVDVAITGLAPAGEHVVAVRAYDEAGNMGVQSVIVRIGPAGTPVNGAGVRRR